jgi:hypothetical protein
LWSRFRNLEDSSKDLLERYELAIDREDVDSRVSGILKMCTVETGEFSNEEKASVIIIVAFCRLFLSGSLFERDVVHRDDFIKMLKADDPLKMIFESMPLPLRALSLFPFL